MTWGFESLHPHSKKPPTLIKIGWRFLHFRGIKKFIIMNINLENIDQVNAVINLTIEKTDYEKQVADVLKDYRQKATIPGFRPGKVPAGLIKKRFGTAVLVEEVNKLISQNLSKYMIDEKLPVLGEPMPNEEKQKPIDWEKDESFELLSM